MTPDELARHLRTMRPCGRVTCDWRARTSEHVDRLDDYVRAILGDSSDANGYREVLLAEARRLTEHWMQYDMAYRAPSNAPPDAAEPFFQVFSPAARYFTNTDGDTWAPKTLHTFDAGVVAIDAATIGLLWFADED